MGKDFMPGMVAGEIAKLQWPGTPTSPWAGNADVLVGIS
jgi:hypothetical protein